LQLFSFGGYGLAHAALALMVFGAIECPPKFALRKEEEDKKVFCTMFVQQPLKMPDWNIIRTF